jgi:peptidyl-dipeptidase Dcp
MLQTQAVSSELLELITSIYKFSIMKILSYSLLATFLFLQSCKTQVQTQTNMTENPLLMEWKTPYGVPPFDKIKNKHFIPAFDKAIEEHDRELEKIVLQAASATFENTVEAVEKSGQSLKKIQSVFFAVNAANTNDSLQQIAKEIAPKLAAHRDNIYLNEDLFQRVQSIYLRQLKLDDESFKLLDEMYKDFVRSGANVKPENKPRLREINARLATLSQEFGDHELKETNAFELYVSEEKDLGNLPAGTKANAEKLALKNGHKNGWSFNAQRTMAEPFLESSPNKILRKKMLEGYSLRGNNDNTQDNKTLIQEIVSLRVEKAQLLGFDNWAAFVLENSMAKTPETVMKFLDELWIPALKMAKTERNALVEKMKSEGILEPFEASDWRYFVEKVRKEKYDFNEDETRPYFELSNVVNGAFTLANKLFGLKFVEKHNLPKWHDDQQVFEVTEADGTHVGIIYMDYYARASKRGGAWMNELREQHYENGKPVSPIVTNNFNFPAPSAGQPTLLSISEVETVFHEFGHGLHGLLSNVKYASLSGTNVPRDFVEFPSQVMENWVTEPEFLKLFATHYQTGEVIPQSLIDKMNKAGKFNQGFSTVEYMAAAYLDMYWHTLNTVEKQDVNQFETKMMQKIGLIEEIIPRYRSTYFQHIFSGGYSAGYYAYQWAEVIDADAFAAFKESGDLFNQELAKKYRYVISKGGSIEGMELYKSFRGRAPKIDALLIKKGFVEIP